MLECLITISAAGLAVGIIFSMPVAGPISILIVSHGLRGQLRYCFTAALGASIIDMLVCFAAVHGFSGLLGLFVDYIPYILIAASAVLLIVGMRIMRARFDFDHLDARQVGLKRIWKMQEKSGFWTGFLLNASNPTLFFGWLTSSFLVLSLVASMGLKVGGLDLMLVRNVAAVNTIAVSHSAAGGVMPKLSPRDIAAAETSLANSMAAERENYSRHFRLFFSMGYAFFVGLGTIVWFFGFSYFLVRNRTRIKLSWVSRTIHALGIFLCGFALYLLWHTVSVLTRS